MKTFILIISTLVLISWVSSSSSKENTKDPSLFFNYSKEVLQKTKNIAAITVNMSNAQTPTSPKEQLQELNLPTAVWIGKEDEVLDAIKVISFFKENSPKSFTEIVEGEKHLSILLTVSNHIGPWIHDIVQ